MLKHSTLAVSPEYYDQVIALCEQSFEYKDDQSFAIDFAPLISPLNHHQNHLFLDDKNSLVGHIGVKIREIEASGKIFSFTLLGGICISPLHRGKGFIKEMLTTVLETYQKRSTFFMLWSDLTEIYQKFDFFEAGIIYQYRQNNESHSPFPLKKLIEFSSKEFTSLKNLFEQNRQTQLTFNRGAKDWELIREITSADWYLNADTNEYFVVNRGRDLCNIIYEHNISSQKILDLMAQQFSVWSPITLDLQGQTNLYTAFFKCANPIHVKDFLNAISNDQFNVKDVENGRVIFSTASEEHELSIKEFISGLWGPDFIEELSAKTKPLYISGLDSI